jgi:transcriptional regulator with XRE-family HTH domain
MDCKTFGANLTRVRAGKNISAYELCLRIGKDTSYLYKVEGGKVNTSLKTICDICDALGIDIKELF